GGRVRHRRSVELEGDIGSGLRRTRSGAGDRAVTVSGERVSTSAGGFNHSWQRHVAIYGLATRFLGPGPVLDLGCGVGHSYRLLAPRETVGIDVEPSVLEGQDRPTVCADMRSLPFPDESFDSVLSVHSIEH